MNDEKSMKMELAEKYLLLGEVLHQRLRNKVETDSGLMAISERICQLEKQIHEVNNKAVPTKEQEICPKCYKKYTPETVFCGECGLNLKEFYEKETDFCPVCNGLIAKTNNYCGICGSKVHR